MDITNAFAAFGLSGAAGLNAWLPLLAGALLHRLGVVDLGSPFDTLSTTWGLVVLSVAFVADFVGDKVPAVDHVLHVIGTVVHPASGAALFAGQAAAGSHSGGVVAPIAGAVVAGIIHLGRAGARPASTATTGGLGNPVLSLLEDLGALALTALAFVVPVLAGLAVIVVLVVLVRTALRVRRRLRPG